MQVISHLKLVQKNRQLRNARFKSHRIIQIHLNTLLYSEYCSSGGGAKIQTTFLQLQTNAVKCEWEMFNNDQIRENELPQIHNVILVVAAINEDLRSVDKQTGKQQNGDLDRVRTAVYQVTVEHVRVVGWRQTVLAHIRTQKAER